MHCSGQWCSQPYECTPHPAHTAHTAHTYIILQSTGSHHNHHRVTLLPLSTMPGKRACRARYMTDTCVSSAAHPYIPGLVRLLRCLLFLLRPSDTQLVLVGLKSKLDCFIPRTINCVHEGIMADSSGKVRRPLSSGLSSSSRHWSSGRLATSDRPTYCRSFALFAHSWQTRFLASLLCGSILGARWWGDILLTAAHPYPCPLRQAQTPPPSTS